MNIDEEKIHLIVAGIIYRQRIGPLGDHVLSCYIAGSVIAAIKQDQPVGADRDYK